jgi:hypothetical protein
MFDVACILKPIVIEITEDLLGQNWGSNSLPRVVVKLDGFDIERIFISLITAIYGLYRVSPT